METLFAKHDRLVRNTPVNIVRSLMNEINWSARLISIQGARGVGKSTLLLQYIKTNFELGDRSVLYCSLDSVYFTSHSLLDLANAFVMNGGCLLVLDEVHKYPAWSKEIKEIYDLYPELKIVFSGSSLLHILNGDADLSRRCIPYKMQGLSFREYLEFYKDIHLPIVSFEDILNHNVQLCEEVLNKCKVIPLFKDYLQFGYYPYYLENQKDYYVSIEQTVNLICEVELPMLCNVSVSNVRKIKALLSVISSTFPFQVDATKLSKMVEVHRNTIVEYLYYLDRSRILNLLFSDILSVKKMQKPDKVFLENTNLLYALSSITPNIGTVRKTFAVNQLRNAHIVEYGKENGDLKVDDKFIFEIGGSEKSFEQIADLPDSYILADDIEFPIRNKLPLWLLGFLY